MYQDKIAADFILATFGIATTRKARLTVTFLFITLLSGKEDEQFIAMQLVTCANTGRLDL